MLIRDPYMQLYVLHVAALFIIALWPRTRKTRAGVSERHRDDTPRTDPGLVRQWTLGPRRGQELARFQELEKSWSAEFSARFSRVAERIRLV